METHERSSSLTEWVDRIQASGRYTFTRAQASEVLPRSAPALRQALGRLVQKGRLLAPRRGFYVIIPLEYHSMEAPPVPWFINDLMHFLGVPYYVGLLTAASLHGASHHAPQVFQVVTTHLLRPVSAGRQIIQFTVKSHLEASRTVGWKTETGSMRVSTPETTALDLVRYAHACGQLDHVATVLSELAESLEPRRLGEATVHEPVAVVQRLGWLLSSIGPPSLADAVERGLRDRETWWVPLVPGEPETGRQYDPRWHVIVNAEIEAET